MKDILDDDLAPKQAKAAYVEGDIFKLRPVMIWIYLLLAGIGFLILRWPGHSLAILISTAGLFAYAFSGLITLKGENFANLLISILAFLWMITLILCMLFNDGNPYNERGVSVYGVVLIIYFMVYEFLKRRRMKAKSQ